MLECWGCQQVDAIEEGAHEGHDEELGLPTGSNPLAVGPVSPDGGSAASLLPPPVRAGQPAKGHGRRAHFASGVSGGLNGGSGGEPGGHPGGGPNGGTSGGPGASGGGANGGGGGPSGGAAGSGPEGRETQGGGSGGSGLVLPERPMDAGAAAEHALLGVGEDSGAAGGQVCLSERIQRGVIRGH